MAEAVAKAGARILRGGAYKPRTSPYSFQGLEEEGLKLLALASKETGLPVVTEITDFEVFYDAEDYHQDYYEKNPIRYKLYRSGCGRDRRLEELWGE